MYSDERLKLKRYSEEPCFFEDNFSKKCEKQQNWWLTFLYKEITACCSALLYFAVNEKYVSTIISIDSIFSSPSQQYFAIWIFFQLFPPFLVLIIFLQLNVHSFSFVLLRLFYRLFFISVSKKLKATNWMIFIWIQFIELIYWDWFILVNILCLFTMFMRLMFTTTLGITKTLKNSVFEVRFTFNCFPFRKFHKTKVIIDTFLFLF